MARFLGTAAGRASGGGAGGGLFTKAKVFDTAGTTTFDVPSNASNVKVYVVGAGSNYRSGTYCFNSDNCCSGVNFPRRYYNACFTGHLTGAGGGYAERTYTKADDQISGKQLTINVGSQGGLTSSGVDGTGLTAVSAENASDTTYTWSCTNNSTARDNSSDNEIEGGFYLPVCGYQNSFNGYVNYGGTATGGEINRTGGKGKIIPEFLYDASLDAYSVDISGGGGGGGGSTNTSSCWVNPCICCMCWRGYHTVFGSHCWWQYWCCANCTCYYLCTFINNLCTNPGGSSGGGGTPRRDVTFYYRGKDTQEGDYDSWTENYGTCSYSQGTTGAPRNAPEGQSYGWTGDQPDEIMAHVVPKGIGASSGYSSSNGHDGRSEGILADVTPYNTTNKVSEDGGNAASGGGGGGAEITMACSWMGGGYDYVFGTFTYNCGCYRYFPGQHSNGGAEASCGNGANPQYCYHCMGFGWNYVFGSCQSQGAQCWTMPFGDTSLGGGGASYSDGPDCVYKTCYNISYLHDTEAGKVDSYHIPLSNLLNHDTGKNQHDIEFGRGATLDKAAAPGGGGNREFTSGGNGLVVVVYG
tara:strand:+ start:332 stop:2074 length:1743 start_codon:yes stop_codon:yes gene_type:complete